MTNVDDCGTLEPSHRRSEPGPLAASSLPPPPRRPPSSVRATRSHHPTWRRPASATSPCRCGWLTRRYLRALQGQGLRTLVWPANDARILDYLATAGVAALVSDDPYLFAPWLARCSPPLPEMP